MFKLTHTTSVNDYYLEFTALANRTQGISPDALLDFFISGLKPNIRRDVISQSPFSMSKAVSLARLFEEKYAPEPKPYFVSTGVKPVQQPQPSASKNTNLPPLLPTPTHKPFSFPHRAPSIKKMSPAEMQLRREKGLCYTCDDKFSINHKCPNRQYLLLLGDDEDTFTPELEPPDAPTNDISLTAHEHHLSFNALKGSHGLGTLRFQGSIQGIKLQIPLDSGSSDNFLQPRIAHCLKLPVLPAENFSVLVGNGNCLTAEGYIPNLQVHVQGHVLQLPVYLLPVTGADLVLGAPWLATLGPHIANYSALTLKFYLGDSFVLFLRAPTQSR